MRWVGSCLRVRHGCVGVGLWACAGFGVGLAKGAAAGEVASV